MKHLLSTAAIGLLIGSASLTAFAPMTPASAQQISDEEDKERKRQTVSSRTGGKLSDIFNFINEEPPQYQTALAELNKLYKPDMEAFDKATVLEIRGLVKYNVGDINGALSDYTQVLQLDVLDRERTANIRRVVAQLYYSEERYAEAIRFMQQYLAGAGDSATANDYFILAGAYYQNDQVREALRPAQRALSLDDDKKQYYDFLNSLYLELGMKEERGQLLETMVEKFPSEEPYWVQLSATYSEAGNDQRAFATLWAAYRAGIIDEEAKIRALAQYYYQLDNPYPGALMFAKEMAAGNVKRDLNNLRLLSQLWAAAREQTKAIEILTEAAPKASDGSLYYQLGQSYSADEQWEKSIESLRAALNKGGLSAREQGNIYLLIGNAYQSIDDETAAGRQRAIDAYRQATRYANSKTQAQRYIDYIGQVVKVECQQDERERIQAVDRQKRAIDSCQGLIEVVELGGAVQVSDEQMAECNALLAQVESGVTADQLVDAELGPRDTAQCRGV